MSTITGYKQDQQGTYISKDPVARLVYTMDWSEWLATGQTITAVDYTENSRVNDTAPLIIQSEGVANAGKFTYCELRGGAVGKVYTVTAEITTDNGAKDRRSFRVKVENRSA
jgi:uncharacterized protein YndB with AHSA1/START domain